MTDAELDDRLAKLSDEDLHVILSDSWERPGSLIVTFGLIQLCQRMAREILDLRAKLLAFVPPKDDGEPVTQEWFDTLGEYNPRSFRRSIGLCEMYHFASGEQCLIDHIGEYRLKTRGDVRRLCAALGIDLKEQPPCPPA
jgi:hypothetical protein